MMYTSKPGVSSDHSLIQIHIQLSNNRMGRGFWKLHNDLLTEKTYLEIIKLSIENI